MIPLIIHQIWYQGEDIPSKYIDFQKTWKINHPQPEWQYMLWTEKKMRILVEKKFKWFLPTWNSYPKFIQRIDTFKLIALFEYGGYYVDLDTRSLKSLSGLLPPGEIIKLFSSFIK